MTTPTLYLIDGSGFIFRAYHALPPLTRPDGTPINAVLGFCNMLQKLAVDLNAEHAAVIFDAGRKTFRNEIYPQYKSHRPEPPDDLKPQFAIVKEAAKAFGFCSFESQGYEADDLIATYARVAREKGWQVVVVSSDKDLMQLIRDGVRLQDPLKNKPIGEAEVLEKFGVTPDKVIDVQALAGDSTDGVPGAPGIGVKTAAKLLGEFGTLEQLLERAGEVKAPKARETLIQFAEQIRISKKLVTLDDHAPLPVELDKMLVDKNPAQLRPFLEQQGFRNLIARLGKTTPASVGDNARPADLPPAPTPAILEPSPLANIKQEYELIQTKDRLAYWCKAATEQGYVAVDTETTSLLASTAGLVGISLALQPGKACYIPVGHVDPNHVAMAGELNLGDNNRPKQLSIPAVVELLKPVLEDPSVLKIGHNLKYDMQVLGQHGIHVAPMDDTMLLSFTLGAGAHGHGLDELAELHFQHKMISFDDVTGKGAKRISFAQVPLDKACDYAAEDADFTLRLHMLLKPRVMAEHMLNFYERIERPMPPVVAEMERTGVRIDTKVLENLSRDFTTRMGLLEQQITKEAGVPFNIASPKQLGEVLFDKLQLPAGKKSKTGAYSTSSDVLEPLAEQGYEIVQKILDWRGLAKLKSTYTDSLPEQISPKTGRVHTSFSLVGAATGRLSSTEPNLQNIPIRTEDGRNIRRAFIADNGHTLLSVDYSQIELRLAAEMAGIKALRQAFADGIDIHVATAASVFNLPIKSVTPEQRRQAKAINFGIIYGISGFGLAKQIGCTNTEANVFIREYLNRFSELRDFMEACKVQAREKGYVETLFGRRIHIQGINDRMRRGFAERQAINAPIQGTAADIMKRAMTRMPEALARAKLKARMMLQVHDELLFDVPLAEKDETARVVKATMESAATLGVPLVAEAGFGQNWAEAH